MRFQGLISFALFLSILAGADWALRRWGSTEIRSRPRPGGRVTVIFVGLMLVLGGMEGIAVWISANVSAGAGLVVALLQFPVGACVAVGIDRVIPSRDPRSDS